MKSILIANRGEIAVRIAKTAKRLGYRTIAVYSAADAAAPQVGMADESILIGPADAADSYLSGTGIIDAAQHSGADMIHPGYGFLSENAAFAQSCSDAGLTFIGPAPRAIELMGDKAAARRRMQKAGVRCIPGYDGDAQSGDALAEAAIEIGYPVMIKAAAGGGGRGMRLVQDPQEFADALRLARAESISAFGSDRLILEKAIQRPRHVEMQIFADQHGNVLHLGERDCSVQRRHQKIIEEAPCPAMTDELRARMAATAIEAAQAISYVGAGTVEFLLDERGEFYFLEMNTRLQVEHPVTEMRTGLDLVEWQIDVARGERLPLAQEQVEFSGHAIEVRLYAEDPAQDFVPVTGRIHLWQEPRGDGVRVDSGIVAQQDVTPWYDPLLAKIVIHGSSRDEAVQRLNKALSRTVLFGPTTNRDFLLRVVNDARFSRGETTTAFIAESAYAVTSSDADTRLIDAAAALLHRDRTEQAMSASVRVAPELLHWSSSGPLSRITRLAERECVHELRVTALACGACEVNGNRVEIVQCDGHTARIRHDRELVEYVYLVRDDRLYIANSSETRSFGLPGRLPMGDVANAGGSVLAPMHGRVAQLCVSKGDTVATGDKLAVLEAMKMQHEIRAHVDGVIATLHCEQGAQIEANSSMLDIKTDPRNKQE
ncbi:MAG: acetyl-CoA carboxylase biotin carboxylase subunit [Gammaproteobacteria bacterium]|nr:acetyl-CoA carboxylase biotin carboxylase subunit [Gammaproteobacteria bacterium]